MGFEALLGNRQLKENLSAAVRRGRISHFYLISGPAGSGKKTLSRLLAAAIHCTGAEKPCMRCAACRKVMADTHPDLITVTDPEHKTVAVEIVRRVRDEMFVRPNESDRKIYVFPQALRDEGQNALLKVLEEPPPYGVFILLSENPESLLTTVRSRCTELKLLPVEQATVRDALRREFPEADPEALEAAAERSGGYLGQAKQILQDNQALPLQVEQLAQAFAGRDMLLLTRTLVSMEDWKNDRFLSVLHPFQDLLHQALLARSGLRAASPAARELAKARDSRELNQAIDCLKQANEYIQGNISVATLCGWLIWALR